WSAKFMRAAAYEITFAQSFGGQFAVPLRRVAEERHSMVPAKRPRLLPRLDHSGFIVGRHHREQSGTLPPQLVLHPSQVHDPAAVQRNKPMPLREIMSRGLDHARMLDRGNPHCCA